MKKSLLFLIVLLFVLISGCTKTQESVVVAYYNDEPIYNYEINAFVEMKKSLFEYALSNLEEVEPVVPKGKEITGREYMDFVMYSQYECMQKGFLDYYNLSEEDKEWDYYVSLMRYNYLVVEQGSVEDMKEYIKTNFEYMKMTPEYEQIEQIIKDVADTYNMTFDQCFEQVYWNVAIDMILINSKPTVFIEEHYQGEVYENKSYEYIMISTNPLEEYNGDMQVFWDSTRNYYEFIDDLNAQFYEYLSKRAEQEIVFP